jgi:hypothetical protein
MWVLLALSEHDGTGRAWKLMWMYMSGNELVYDGLGLSRLVVLGELYSGACV